MDACSRNRRMIKAMGELDERPDIIRSRRLADDKVSLKELGEKYQISLERVRQLEKQWRPSSPSRLIRVSAKRILIREKVSLQRRCIVNWFFFLDAVFHNNIHWLPLK